MIRRPASDRRLRLRGGGFALPAVLLFLTAAFGAWAVLFRSSASILRVEQARTLRESRNTWSAPAMAAALRLLETGTPPTDPYTCKVTLAEASQTRYLLLTFEKIGVTRWEILCAPTDAADLAPDAPTTFQVVAATPSGLTATAVSATQIDLAWSNVAGESGYEVERSANGVSGWTLVGTTVTNVITFSNTPLAANTTYYYRVRAVNSSGNSGYSNTASAKTILATPAGLTATPYSSSRIDLTWANISGETGYLIERSPNGSSGWTQMGTNAANDVTYSDTGLSANATWHYRVRASGASGNSGYSNTVSATTHAGVPLIPTNLTPTVMSPTSIRLNWTDNSGNESGFRIQRSTNGTTWTTVATTAANATTYTNSGLTTGTLYHYRIRANSTSGNSAYTASVTATPN